ncbi:MAG: (d)CMP kinase [Eubacteriales bacterium]|nr:(d)CMP kinase [Eubacteriales bacterium]
MSFQIAIDGPAGAGKSTIARKVSAELGFIYVDTGAMYRAMGLFFLDRKIDSRDLEKVKASLDDAVIELEIVDGVQHVILNGEDVSTRIRTEEAGMMASAVSAIGEVREKLVSMQQQIAASRSIVMDGRDIGTVVLPHAPLKIFLTAGVMVRAERRYKELLAKGQEPDLAAIAADIEKRDHQDMTRAVSPLKQAEDAILLDTSDMNIEEVTEAIIRLAKERL